jgi:LEA14-like dessication related protein
VFLSKRRVILIGTIAAIAAAIVLLPWLLTFTLPTNVNDVAIHLTKVEVGNIVNDGGQRLPLNVYFDIYNPTKQTLTTSKIEYKLLANSTMLGEGNLSYEDVPVNGRPQLLSNSTTTLKSPFEVIYSNSTAKLFKMLANSTQAAEAAKQIKWGAEGVAQIESGFISSPKEFNESPK